MDRGRKRWMLRLTLVVLVGVVMLLWALRQQSQSFLTIVNQSGQTIAELTVTAAEQHATYRDIGIGEQVPVQFVTRGEQIVSLAIKMQDDGRRRFTGPAGEHLRLIVLPGEIITPQTGDRH
jgi:hypothetical protein